MNIIIYRINNKLINNKLANQIVATAQILNKISNNLNK